MKTKDAAKLNGQFVPHSQDMEDQVIGSCIIETNLIPLIKKILTPEDFYNPTNQKIYKLVLDMHGKSEGVDATTVSERLKALPDFNKKTAVLAVTGVTAAVATTTNAEHYARIVLDKSVLRSTINDLEEVRHAARDEAADALDVVERAQTSINRIAAKITSSAGDDDFSDSFSDEVFKYLPGSLFELCRHADRGFKRDLLLLGALSVLTTCLSNVRTKYGSNWHSLNLYFVIIASASSGKSFIMNARRIGEPLDNFLFDKSKQLIGQWRKDKGKSEASGSFDHDDKPPLLRLFIAGDTSSSAVKRSLADTPNAAIFETEIKTMAAALNNDWGDYRDVLLKGYQNEPITVDRAGYDPLQVRHPALTVCITGTMGSFEGILRDTEDGLFSRMSFYGFEGDDEFKNQFETKDETKMELMIKRLSEKLPSLWQALMTRDEPLYVTVDKKDQDLVVSAGTKAMAKLAVSGHDKNLQANIKRSALTAIRIAGILSIFNTYEMGGDLENAKTVFIRRRDLITGLRISFSMLDHAFTLSEQMKRGGRKAQRSRFFDLLPSGTFQLTDAYEIGLRLDLKQRTVRDWLKKLAEAGEIQDRGYGKWFKPHKKSLVSGFRACVSEGTFI